MGARQDLLDKLWVADIHRSSHVESPSVEVRPIVDIVASAGFQLAADGELAASSPCHGYDGATPNYLDLLFQASGYFDSPWDTVLD